ncbi:MAG: MOSC domain-containing protein [Acidobacteria bacterium]|nr:MOSC domain-containing protein [Acidobacteriota bacterium]
MSELITKGQLKAIWVKRMKRGPMDKASSATLVTGKGLLGNANQGGKRQVTIIEEEVWQNLMKDLQTNLDPNSRRANLMISGISLVKTRNQILKIGNCRLRILGETKPCERMDEAFLGLREAMKADWGGGAFAEVLDDGEIFVGDLVSWEKISN